MSDKTNAAEGFGSSPLLGGMPIFRAGDKVFLIGQMPSFTDTMRDEAKARLERGMLAYDNYRCPFDFLGEHKQWFEWHRRLHFEKQSTGRIITDMLADVKRIKAHKIDREIMFRVANDFGFRAMMPRRAMINCST